MAVKEITQEQFETEIKKEKVLVDFFATWCMPCKMMGRTIEDLVSKDELGVDVAKVDVDKNEQLAAKFGIMSIPTVILFENGVPVKKNVGALSKEDLKEFVK